MAVPVPPTHGLNPLSATVVAGTLLYRVHSEKLDPPQFNPGIGAGRFHPLFDHSTDPATTIPTMYVSPSQVGALSESVFRNVPVRGANKRVAKAVIDPLRLSAMRVLKDLNLADFSGLGLHRCGISRL